MAERMNGRCAIVGAGYAGMAAAVTLAQRGIPVTVFETNAVAGGRARRVRIVSDGQDAELDNGQHILIGAYSELLRLMGLVGVPANALLRVPLELRYADGFAFRSLSLPFPLNLAGGLLLARGIPLAERLSVMRFMAAMQRAGFALSRDCTVEELLETHKQGGRIGHYLWRPLCVSALNTPAADASAALFLAVLRDALFGPPGASDLLLPRVDLSRLFPEPAAKFVEAHGGDLVFKTSIKDLAELQGKFKHIIVAVGPHQIKTLLPALEPAFTYQPIYTCYLQYPESTRLEFPMLGLAGGLVQWVFDRGMLTGENGRLACIISAQGDHQQLSLDELAKACHGELAQALPQLPAPLWSRVIAEKRATISCVPDLKRMPIETGLPGVYLAGDHTDPGYPPTLEAAVRSGIRAAQLIQPS